MKPFPLLKKKYHSVANKIILISTAIIAVILLIAAYGKWFYPVELLKIWDRSISLFELVFIGFLFYAGRSFKSWILAAVVFASWGGYAYFWYQLELPCHCMGEMLQIPTGFSLILDSLFFAVSLCFIYLLGGSKKRVGFGVVGGAIGFVLGFLLANELYHHFIFVSG